MGTVNVPVELLVALIAKLPEAERERLASRLNF